MLNCTFKSINTFFLTENKLAYHLNMWKAFLIQIQLIIPLMITSMIMDSILMALTINYKLQLDSIVIQFHGGLTPLSS